MKGETGHQVKQVNELSEFVARINGLADLFELTLMHWLRPEGRDKEAMFYVQSIGQATDWSRNTVGAAHGRDDLLSATQQCYKP
jgi:hypothetical protein